MLILLASGVCGVNAQITILDEDIQEKIVSKPQVFDSLSNIAYQKDPVQYNQYIGYKLFSLPISSKYKCTGISHKYESITIDMIYKVRKIE